MTSIRPCLWREFIFKFFSGFRKGPCSVVVWVWTVKCNNNNASIGIMMPILTCFFLFPGPLFLFGYICSCSFHRLWFCNWLSEKIIPLAWVASCIIACSTLKKMNWRWSSPRPASQPPRKVSNARYPSAVIPFGISIFSSSTNLNESESELDSATAATLYMVQLSMLKKANWHWHYLLWATISCTHETPVVSTHVNSMWEYTSLIHLLRIFVSSVCPTCSQKERNLRLWP